MRYSSSCDLSARTAVSHIKPAPKSTYDIYIVSLARYRPWVKLTGLDLVPARYWHCTGYVRVSSGRCRFRGEIAGTAVFYIHKRFLFNYTFYLMLKYDFFIYRVYCEFFCTTDKRTVMKITANRRFWYFLISRADL